MAYAPSIRMIRETIEALTGEERYADALMDDYSTLRNDRYVLPIKASNKRAGLGIVLIGYGLLLGWHVFLFTHLPD